MLEPSEATFCCTECSHRTAWPFQLDHHIQKQHKNVYANATELFHARIAPEQYSCPYCCSSSGYYKLDRYEHCQQDDEKLPFCKASKKYTCDFCKWSGHSVLLFAKHSCAGAAAELENPQEFIFVDVSVLDGVQSEVQKDKTCVAEETFWWSCTKCSFRTKTKYNLTPHMLVHVPGEQVDWWFNCTKCSYRAKQKRYLKRHMQQQHAAVDIKGFKCVKCSYWTKLKRDLKRHMLIHAAADQVDWHNCAKCSFRTKYKHNLKTHALIHAKSDGLKCFYREEPERNESNHVAVKQEPWFNCSRCSFRTKLEGNLNVHMSTHARDYTKWFNCTECSYQSRLDADLTRHMLTHASADYVDDWFNCDQCSFRTKHKPSLELHILKQHADNTGHLNYCTKCPFRSDRKSSLVRHMLTHAAAEEIDWFDCSNCSFRTKYKRNLKMHMVTHAKPEEIVWHYCTSCSYRTRVKPDLKKHMVIHATGDEIEWFDCDVCFFRTKRKKGLKSHMLVHARVEEMN